MSQHEDGVRVREAVRSDLDRIVEFNARLALETESKRLDRQVLRRGVEAALAEPSRLRYWVATHRDQVIGQSAVTREWSDWRDGYLWWLQSVYVATEHRRRGALRLLIGAIRAAARAEGVLGLRLYVEHANAHAQAAYRRLGFVPGGYAVYEDLWGIPLTTGPDD